MVSTGGESGGAKNSGGTTLTSSVPRKPESWARAMKVGRPLAPFIASCTGRSPVSASQVSRSRSKRARDEPTITVASGSARARSRCRDHSSAVSLNDGR